VGQTASHVCDDNNCEGLIVLPETIHVMLVESVVTTGNQWKGLDKGAKSERWTARGSVMDLFATKLR